MADKLEPMEKMPSQEDNPFIISKEDNPFKIDPKDNPFKGYDRPASTKEKEPKVEKKKEEPSVFKGAYGTARRKYLSFIFGKKEGYKDFKSYDVKPTVRQKMLELREKFFPKNQEYIKKFNLQLEVNKMKRELGYKTGDDHTAAVKFLKEIEDKTGIK